MPDRAALIDAALNAAGWGAWVREPLAGDASRRRYERMTGPDGDTRFLMDAPPDAVGGIGAFLHVAAHLSAIGLHAPRIDLAEPALGLVVMEDFGDLLLARCAAEDPEEEPALYAAAAEVLAHLQAYSAPAGLPTLDATEAVRLVAQVAEWIPASRTDTDAVLAELDRALRWHLPATGVMALRDYHAENLVLCPAETGLRRLGLLDFQDAVLASPVYDLASLIRDVRRDVSEGAVRAAVARFAELTGTAPDALSVGLAVQGVQRNLRILGIFHRLAERDGKPRYLDFLPRLRRLLLLDLSHSELTPLARAAQPLLDSLVHDA